MWRLWRHSLKSAALFFDLLLCCHEGVDISNVSLSKWLCLGMSIYIYMLFGWVWCLLVRGSELPTPLMVCFFGPAWPITSTALQVPVFWIEGDSMLQRKPPPWNPLKLLSPRCLGFRAASWSTDLKRRMTFDDILWRSMIYLRKPSHLWQLPALPSTDLFDAEEFGTTVCGDYMHNI